MRSSEPIYKFFSGKFHLFALTFFDSPQFAALVARVKTAQDAEADNFIQFSEPAKNEIRSIKSEFFVPAMSATQAEFRNVAKNVKDLSQIVSKQNEWICQQRMSC